MLLMIPIYWKQTEVKYFCFRVGSFFFKEDETCGACSTNEEKSKAYRLLVGKPEKKRPLGKPRRRWMDNIKMALGQIGWDDVDWIGLA
jgi:hypothetical protein